VAEVVSATPNVSPRARRLTKIVLIGFMVAIAALIGLNDFMERRAIDYENAREIYAELKAGGFACDSPYFPSGNHVPAGYSRVTCERGFVTVDIGVNEERGRWLGYGGEPYEGRGRASLGGSNWWIHFSAPMEATPRLATEAQEIIGGEVEKELPPDDDV